MFTGHIVQITTANTPIPSKNAGNNSEFTKLVGAFFLLIYLCRMGEFCTFKNRCMFLHPSDYIEPLKKQPKQQQTNTPLLKRAQTLG